MGRIRRTQSILGVNCWLPVFLMAAILSVPAAAQTFTVLHSFMGSDGGTPNAGLTMDRAGNLYGTTMVGGNYNPSCFANTGCGTVFKLSHSGTGWVLSELYRFNGTSDGATPMARVVLGPDGALYGTTYYLGPNGDGTVFKLQPPATFCHSISCPWTQTTLIGLAQSTGDAPLGDLTFDAAGNIYGTTALGGIFRNCEGSGCGVVYKLSRSGGSWTEDILYNFTDGADGGMPASGVIFDQAGNLYGTTMTEIFQGHMAGVVFELSPSSGSWTEKTLYHFTGGDDGSRPNTPLIRDAAGNLYGTTEYAGSGRGGTAFELSPAGNNWNFTLLQSFSGLAGSEGALIQDAAGNLYGTTNVDGLYGYGSVFKLTPSNGGYVYTSLHDFTAGSDGAYPYSNLVMDSQGNLYGTASSGGLSGHCWNYLGYPTCGVVFEITP